MPKTIVCNNHTKNKRVTLLYPEGYKLFSRKPYTPDQFKLFEYESEPGAGAGLLRSRTLDLGVTVFGKVEEFRTATVSPVSITKHSILGMKRFVIVPIPITGE